MDGMPLIDPTDYQSIVSGLQYLSLTHPDIAFSVNKLSQFMHRPTISHWSTVKRLLLYLNGTVHHGLFLRKSSPLCLHAFSKTDWAGDRHDCTLTIAHIIFLGHNVISWSSKK